MLYLGIDLGTSGVKSALFDPAGSLIASVTAEYPMSQPALGWAEQDPRDWWRAAASAVKDTVNRAGISPGDIGGVGLSGQMHGLVMLDANGEILRPAILWCDGRSEPECAELERLAGGRERMIALTANPALPGFTASKILWVKNHEPHIFERCAKILLPKDYIRYKLTGEFAAEVSDASGTQLLDVSRREWSGKMLSLLELRRDMLPDVYESPHISAAVSAEGAEATGLRQGTPVAGGAGDQAAGAVGNGIVTKGLLSSTIGTSGVVFAHLDSVALDPLGRVHTFCHAVPGAWHMMGVTQAAGLSLKWFRDVFCCEEKNIAELIGEDPYTLLDREASRSPIGSRGVLYLPYLMGERTPHLDAAARGVFFGLSAMHTKSDMLRAVMEGVTFSLRDSLSVLRELSASTASVRTSGGGGRSPFWRQLQADIFNLPVEHLESSEGSALGAALLAAVGTGEYASVPEACAAVIKPAGRIDPSPEAASEYDGLYEFYISLYPALKRSFAAHRSIYGGK